MPAYALTEAPLLPFLDLEGIKLVYQHGHAQPERISPDNWQMDFRFMERPNARRVQLDLLTQACEYRRRARVAISDLAGDPASVNTRFLALEPDALLLEWPRGGGKRIPIQDATVDVFFSHNHKHFTFRTKTQGRTWWRCARRGSVAAWRLAVPLRLEPGQQRAHFRVCLADLDPAKARFFSVSKPDRSFVADVTNLSAGGLGATASTVSAGVPSVGEVFWVSFKLPGDRERLELIVRLVHVRELKPTATVVLGGTFCPGEDPAAYRARLSRIERFVLARDLAKTRRLRARNAEGA